MDPTDLDARRMAMSGRPVLESARVVATLQDAIADAGLAIATTRRAGKNRGPFLDVRAAAERAVRAAGAGNGVALVFGREDAGLTTAELDACHLLARIPADPEYPSQTGARADGRDLTQAWTSRSAGSAYVWNREQLEALDLAQTDRLLGLFEPSDMQWEAHRARDAAGEPSLAEMTEVALTRLARHDGGFMLMVEGGRIDHGHHAGSAFLALHDTIAFSQAVERALRLVDLDETLVVVTADHSHVFTIAGYPTRGNPILGVVVANDKAGEPKSKPALDAQGLPYTTLGYANGPGYTGASDQQPAGAKRFPHFATKVERGTAARPDLGGIDTQDPFFLQESTVPTKGETHGGEDVAIYAGGPGSALFHGVQEQSYIYYAIRAALAWREPRGRGSWFRRLGGSER